MPVANSLSNQEDSKIVTFEFISIDKDGSTVEILHTEENNILVATYRGKPALEISVSEKGKVALDAPYYQSYVPYPFLVARVVGNSVIGFVNSSNCIGISPPPNEREKFYFWDDFRNFITGVRHNTTVEADGVTVCVNGDRLYTFIPDYRLGGFLVMSDCEINMEVYSDSFLLEQYLFPKPDLE